MRYCTRKLCRNLSLLHRGRNAGSSKGRPCKRQSIGADGNSSDAVKFLYCRHDKYANQTDTVRILKRMIPCRHSWQRCKKFQYKLIKSGARASQYGDAIDWLIRAGIVNKCMKCSQGFIRLRHIRM